MPSKIKGLAFDAMIWRRVVIGSDAHNRISDYEYPVVAWRISMAWGSQSIHAIAK